MTDEKLCGRCGETRSVTEFHPMQRSSDGLQSECKPCQKARNADWYERNREAKLAATRERVAANRARLVELKLTLKCADCGWQPATANEVSQLDFDHTDPATKYRGSTRTGAFNASWTWARIEQELKLCVARCRTCHMARTTREGHRQRRYNTTRR